MIEWRLEGLEQQGGVVSRLTLRPLPFLVGRRSASHLRLSSSGVSIEHASFYESAGELWLRDLGSTNGTFVNGERLSSERKLEEGDIVHFADEEFRVSVSAERIDVDLTTSRMEHTAVFGALHQVQETRELLEALEGGAVRAAFQPVIDLRDNAVIAYEALGRVRRAGLPSLPGDLFALAQRLSLVRQLSNAFRRQALVEAIDLPADGGSTSPAVLVNTHPLEVTDSDELFRDLAGFRELHPETPLVLEIHEAALSNIADFVRLRSKLSALDIELAFDDFGKGASRFQEICDASPDYVKFDRSFAAEIHASERRTEMTRSLVEMMGRMGIRTVLEGVETEAEDTACRQAGFDLGQGYYYGRPAALEELPPRS